MYSRIDVLSQRCIMPYLSLTDLVDIVSANGTPKMTKIRQIKHRPQYEPAHDFYRRLRETIQETHESNLSKNHLNSCLVNLTDKNKMTLYPPLISAYRKWWGKKNLTWFSPAGATYSHLGFDIGINPELGLEIAGVPHLIKLYFKGDPLVKNRIDIITHLMSVHALPYCANPNTVMGVLDIRRSKLITPTVPIQGLSNYLNAEMAFIASIWPTI